MSNAANNFGPKGGRFRQIPLYILYVIVLSETVTHAVLQASAYHA